MSQIIPRSVLWILQMEVMLTDQQSHLARMQQQEDLECQQCEEVGCRWGNFWLEWLAMT